MIDRELAVGANPAVRITIRSGRVNVEEGEAGFVRFLVDTSDRSFEVHKGADAIVASGGGGRAFVTVSVPPLAHLEIGTSSADVSVVPRLGQLDVSTVSGEIDFDSTMRLQARSTSGVVRGRLVEGEATCVTTSGDIRLSDLRDRADLSSSSGSIVVGSCAGSVSCATLSGNIRIEELTGPAAKVKSMSGQVRLGIPPRTRVDLDANTLSGKVTLPTPSPSPEPPEREIALKVRLVSGNLKIERTT